MRTDLEEYFTKKGVTAERGAGRHYFHAECLARWAERSTACPVCRCRVEVSGVATVMQHRVAPCWSCCNKWPCLARWMERAGCPVGRCRVEPKLPACPWVRALYTDGDERCHITCLLLPALLLAVLSALLVAALPVRLKCIVSTLNRRVLSGACRAPLELP